MMPRIAMLPAGFARLAPAGLLAAGLVLAGALPEAGTARAASSPDLSVCIDSASAASARDQSLAEAVARRQNLNLSVHHFDGAGDDDGFSAKQFRALLAGTCDLVLGYPIDTTGGEPPPGLKITAPYDQTGYVLVTSGAAAGPGLADLPDGTTVAVTYGAIPNLYFVTHHNVQSDIHLSEAETLSALVDGHVPAAMLWQPTIAQYLAAHADARLSVHPLAEPHARFNIVALYGPGGAPAAAQFEAGVQAAAAAPKKAGMLDQEPAPHRRLGWRAPRRPIQLAATVTGGGGTAEPGGVPALYTAAQAKAGAAKYSDNCAQCHGATMDGQSGPALKGKLFASVKTGFSVGDILGFMSVNMPATQPGSLSHDDYTDIMAYVLQQNGFPAGGTALTFDGGSASKVPLIYHGK